MATSAQSIIDVAKKYIRDTPYTDANIFVRSFYTYYDNAGNPNGSYPWCAMFVWYCFKETNSLDIFLDSSLAASCTEIYKWGKNRGLIINISNSAPGDLVIFDYGDGKIDHIGIIANKNNNGSYTIIEGNTPDDKVKSNTYSSSYMNNNVYSIVRPMYSDRNNTIGQGYGTGSGLSAPTDNGINLSISPVGINSITNSMIEDEIKNYILAENTTHTIAARSELTQKIEGINNYIKNGHDTTAYIQFRVNGFELDTSDSNSFKHYAVSLENQKTGVGQGNRFKLVIAYNKHFSNYGDINQLELALGPLQKASLMSYENNNMSNARQSKNVCYLRYGYLNSENIDQAPLNSPEYEGLLLKYSINANSQIVKYTLEGYTGEKLNPEYGTISWVPNIKSMSKTEIPDYDNGISTTVPVAEVTTKSLSQQISESERQAYINELLNEFQSGLTFNPYNALDCFLQDYNQSTSEDSEKYLVVDCTGRDTKLSDPNTLQPVRMSICKGQTPLQYIEYLISLFKYKSTTNYAIQFLQQQNKTSERFIYYIQKSKNWDNINYVCIDVIDDNDTDSKVVYTFTGYDENNSLMIDYDLNYDGTIALAMADNYQEDNRHKVIYIDKDGVLRSKASITRDMFIAGEIDEVLIAKQNNWLDRISVANNCTMRTFGLPFKITVGTIFKCGLYISESLHHSSGNCFVTGITDKIQNSNFTTEFNMIRLPGANSAIDQSAL